MNIILVGLKSLAFALVSSFIYPLACYFVDRKKLRRFPSPSVAAFTWLWLVYQSSTGQRFKTIDAVHKKLGKVVRIAPNHVSFSDPRAYKDIYGHGSPILKDDFYLHVADAIPSISQTTSRAEHTRKRKALSHAFSAREIAAMEPRVVVMIQKLCRNLHLKSEGRQVSDTDAHPTVDGVFDVRPWLNMFSYDAITAMFWSNPYGFLDKGNDLCPSMSSSGKVKQVHAMDSFHSGSRFNVMFGPIPLVWNKLAKRLLAYTHNRQAGISFGGMARYQVAKRLVEPPLEPDLFSHLPLTPSAKWPTPMPLEELIAESATMLDAGNDTTQTSLTSCTFHLARNPAKQQKLHAILTQTTSAADPSKPVVLYSEQLQQIQYLRAVLDENFRCKPPVSIGLPRRTTAGATIAGHFIPPGITVSVPLYTLHHDENLFTDAWDFIPERWLAEDDDNRGGWVTSRQEAKNLKDFVLPFSLGGRACIGRNLAYMELSMVIAALVLGFEWELAVPDSEMEMVERFNCNPKGLMVRAKVRPGVNWAS
ncbi:hypothetical protein FSOLCH5_007747 [Fusarium solani]|uniref:uncharacterized protein n=1 Tax=Fusarium solani TaxID=169388 RepID=UPI0023157985|nr:hypothetical protein MRS44_010850 [Fusarium solani]KAJ4203434.1 hypothetical protein NW759_015186 [Fusarium solani]